MLFVFKNIGNADEFVNNSDYDVQKINKKNIKKTNVSACLLIFFNKMTQNYDVHQTLAKSCARFSKSFWVCPPFSVHHVFM